MTKAVRSAYSLLELVVVMTIVTSLALVALPRYGSAVDEYRVEQAVRHVVGQLNRARSGAVLGSKAVSVEFDSAVHKIRSTDVAGLDSKGRTDVVYLTAEPYFSTLENVNFNGTQVLNFDAFGNCLNPGTFQIKSGNKLRTIQVTTENVLWD